MEAKKKDSVESGEQHGVGGKKEPTVMIMYERKHSGVCANLKS